MPRSLPCCLLLLAACGSPRRPAPIQEHVALTAVQGCPAVQAAIQDAATAQMRHQLDALIESRRSSKSSIGFFGGPTEAAGGATPRAGGDGGGPAPAPSAWTTTNVQTSGVDEPDFVKNDGTHLFVLSGRKLYAAGTWPPSQLLLGAALDIEGYPSDMFLDEKGRVVVLSQIPPAQDGKANPGAGAAPCPMGLGIRCGYFGALTTKLTVVDARDTGALSVISQTYLPGAAAHSRRIGAQVHVVLTDSPRWPKDVSFWPAAADWNDEDRFASAVAALEEKNEQLIRAQPLDGWLPPAKRVVAGQTFEQPFDCSQFRVSNAPERLGFVTVATLDLDSPSAPVSRSTLLADGGGLIYASAGSLYIASQHWWWWSTAEGDRDWTYLHRFDIGHPGGAIYVASGGFEGHVPNQFALDEHDGYLRLAANVLRFHKSAVGTWPNIHDTWTVEQSNALRVLATEGNRLTVVGEIPELAKGESVQSARFVGDRGYVVTFRRVDPLFAVDLRDPRNPKVGGALELTGFSTYLHPMDDTHLLAIGVDQPADPSNWRDRTLQLSVFDVADIAAPKRTAQARVGSAWSSSDALFDHHAFNWFPEKQLLAVPFSDWQPSVSGGSYWNSFTSELRVFSVKPDAIVAQGGLSMKDLFVTSGGPSWSWSWSPWIRRSVMASDEQGRTYVYAISDAGIRVASVASLSQPIATVGFPLQP